jgi:hypothetical protein
MADEDEHHFLSMWISAKKVGSRIWIQSKIYFIGEATSRYSQESLWSLLPSGYD